MSRSTAHDDGTDDTMTSYLWCVTRALGRPWEFPSQPGMRYESRRYDTRMDYLTDMEGVFQIGGGRPSGAPLAPPKSGGHANHVLPLADIVARVDEGLKPTYRPCRR